MGWRREVDNDGDGERVRGERKCKEETEWNEEEERRLG